MGWSRLLPVLLLIAAGLACGCRSKPEAAPVRPVKVVQVGDPGALSGRRWFPGRARATQELNVSFRVAGPLVVLPVKVGDRVKKGQLIAHVDSRDFDTRLTSAQSQVDRSQAQLEAMKKGARPEEIAQLEAGQRKAQADVDTAQTEYNREVQLLAKKATTQADVDRAARRLQATTASLDQANEALRIGKNGARKEDLDAKNAEIESLQASVDAAKHQLDDTYLYAPFDGDVAAVYVENFQNVQPKEAIVRLLDTAQIEMTVDVPETLMYDVPQVKNAVVRFAPLGEREFAARIKEIGTEASRATGTFPVTLIIDQPEDVRILPGMTGEAQARDEGSDRKPTNLVVPLAATFADPGAPKDKAYVWVFDRASKTVSRKAVTLGQPTAQGIQIEGLQAGDWVVTAGVHHLEEGQKVEMMQ